MDTIRPMSNSVLKVLFEAGVRFPVMPQERAEKLVEQLRSASVIDAGEAERLAEALTAPSDRMAGSSAQRGDRLVAGEIARLHERIDHLEALLTAVSNHLGVSLDAVTDRGRSTRPGTRADAGGAASAERTSVVDELLELADLADIFFG